jgi:RHS repeat-associated protein
MLAIVYLVLPAMSFAALFTAFSSPYVTQDKSSGVLLSSIEDIEPIVNWEKKQNADQRLEVFGNDFLGDAIDPHTGSLVFSHTDIDIPGNSKLRVTLSRQRASGGAYKDGVDTEFGDWTISVPRILVTSLDARPWTGQRCSKRSSEILTSFSNRSSFMLARDYSNGITMELPGQSSQQILDQNNNPIFPSTAKKVTKNHWYFTCLSASDGGQGFLGHAPNGNKYYFNRAYILDAPKMGFVGANPLERNVYILAATQIRDVHGNYVNYNYDSRNRLTSIVAKDGRKIALTYSGSSKLISSATAGGKTWRYVYRTNKYRLDEWMPFFPNPLKGKVLSRVTQPDGKYWEMNLDNMSATPAPSGRDYCGKWQHSMSIKHPYGAVGTFTIKDTEHRHVYASRIRRTDNCFGGEPIPGGGGGIIRSDPGDSYLLTSNRHTEDAVTNAIFMPLDDDVATSTMSVIEKSVSGPSMTSATWTYTYENDDGPSGSSSSDRTNWTKVDAPEGHFTYYHAWVSEPLAGKLIRKETRNSASGSLLRAENYTYQSENSIGKSYILTYPGPGDLERPVHTVKVTTTQSGDTYTAAYGFNINHNASNYSYSRPVSQSVKSNVSSGVRSTITHFGHNKANWILSLPVKQTVNGRVTSEKVFDSKGRLTSEKRNRALYATYGYHTNGNLAWVRDADSRMTQAASYKRGVPQHIRRADGKSTYQNVDSFGRTTSLKDARGYTTLYSRDAMGRLLVVNPTGSWKNTVHSYSFSGNPRHTISRGGARTTIEYDAMFRPIFIETRDMVIGESSYVRYNYDAAGREVFVSLPSLSPNSSAGTTSKYDGLSRLIEQRETVFPYATIKQSYHGSHRHTIKDADGYQTHFYSYGYDGPDGKDYRAIRSPHGKNTDIRKNVWGEITSIRQWGNQNGYSVNQTRYYYYDAKHRLCRISEPDVGNTVYQYNNSNWLIAYQKGLGNGSACSTPSGSGKVSLVRNTLGQITKRDFAHGGTPDISKIYDANGNLLSVKRGGVDWVYKYNDVNLLIEENLDIDNRQFQLRYSYDSSANLTSSTLPTQRNVQHNPDGLGRARQARWGGTAYVNNATYHPEGQLKRMQYGNGQVYSQTLNSRGLPQRITSSKGANKPLDLTYNYNKRGLVTNITDASPRNLDLSLGYDGLEQIISATGTQWGTGEFKYDSLGNIRFKRLGGRRTTVSYNSKYQVSKSIDVGNLGGNTGTRGFNHDSRGNITKAGNLSFNYNYADQPTRVSGDANGSYTYDGNLKRVKSVINGKTRYNIYNLSGQLVHIYDLSKNEKTDYIKLGNMTIARVVNNQPTYLHFDALGSPVGGTNSSGSVSFYEWYTPFGITLNNHSSNDNQAGFTGHIKDSDTGLVYMQARYYDPVIGRFYSNDPVDAVSFLSEGNVQGFGRYTYVNNNPYKYTDPDGKALNFITGGIGALVGGVSGAISARITTGDWSNSGAAFAAGAVVGGAIGATFGAAAIYAAPLSTGAFEATTLGAAVATSATGAFASGAGDALGQVISTGEVGDVGSVVSSTVLGAATGPWSSLAKAGQIGAVGQAAIPATMNTIATPLKDAGAEIINKSIDKLEEKN